MTVACHVCGEDYRARSDRHCPHCGSLDSVNYDDEYGDE